MDSISQLLSARQAEARSKIGRVPLGASVILHGLLLVGVFVVPALFAKPKTFEYVDVELLPAAALNPSPRPTAARPKPQPKPPEPEPEPEPDRKPPPEDVPVLETKKKKEPEPKPKPTPVEVPEDAGPVEETPPELTSPVGADKASSSGISGSSNVGFSDPEFQRLYNYYVDRLIGLIRQHWSPPVVGGDVRAILRFDIARNGQVSGLEVLDGSGLDAFDSAATRAVNAASPLPPLPRSYREDNLGVTVRFRDRALSR
ncbi:MAG: energy transducer TonB [Acidobacteriota bacterium]